MFDWLGGTLWIRFVFKLFMKCEFHWLTFVNSVDLIQEHSQAPLAFLELVASFYIASEVNSDEMKPKKVRWRHHRYFLQVVPLAPHLLKKL